MGAEPAGVELERITQAYYGVYRYYQHERTADIGGNMMTGSVTETDACYGEHLGQFTRPLTVQRK